MTSYKPLKMLGLLLLTSFLLVSCDKKPVANKAPEAVSSPAEKPDLEKLKIRALARWNALIDSEWSEAYSYQTPSYKKNYSRKQFINSYGTAVGWRKIEYNSTKKINDELADITLTLNISFESVVLPTNITERWQFSDGNWWHVKQ